MICSKLAVSKRIGFKTGKCFDDDGGIFMLIVSENKNRCSVEGGRCEVGKRETLPKERVLKWEESGGRR